MSIYRSSFYEKKPKVESPTEFYAMISEMHHVPYSELAKDSKSRTPLSRRRRRMA